MKAFVIAAFLLFISVLTHGQEKFLAWNETKPLQWDDFYGKVNDTSHFEAESFAEVTYSYRFKNSYDFDFNVKAIFNRKTSWIKDGYKSEPLLKHEQVHFDIAELYARKLKPAFYRYSYSSNFEQEILDIFNQMKTEYHQMQKQYDEETNHSTIAAKQKAWEIFIKDELDRVKKINFQDRADQLFVKAQ